MEKTHARIINNVMVQKTQEKAIEYLRSLEFEFLETEPLLAYCKAFKPLEKHIRYSWMIRRVRKGGMDYSLIFGLKMWGKKVESILVYSHGQYYSRMKTPWKDAADINFRKLVITLKFPDELTYDQRRKWRNEHKKVEAKKDYQPSAFYLKWKPKVNILKPGK
jgi:hypothetical protein